MNVSRYSGVGASLALPTEEYSNVWDFIFNMSIMKGGHALKWGFEYRPIDFPFSQSIDPNGSWWFLNQYTGAQGFTGRTGDSAATFLLGMPVFARLMTSNTISSQKETYSAYFQDDWKVSPKLTINIGIRYDLFSPISEKFGRQASFAYWRETPTLVIPQGANQDAPLPPNFYPQVDVERGRPAPTALERGVGGLLRRLSRPALVGELGPELPGQRPETQRQSQAASDLHSGCPATRGHL